VIKIGFFDKINYNMIVNAFKKSETEDTVKYFYECPASWYVPLICFTVSGIPQD